MNDCYFYRCDHCAILAKKYCSSKCKFKKSAEEYDEGLIHADEILEKKNLKRATAQDKKGNSIITTVKKGVTKK